MSTIIIDDTDSHWAYSAGWYTVPSTFAYNGASQCTETDGASVTLRFRGKFILLYSVVPASNTTTDFSRVDMQLDGGPMTTFSSRAWDVPFHNNLVWESSGLPETDHTLTLTWVARPNTVGFCLDKFWIQGIANSAYVPELLDPLPVKRAGIEGLERRDLDEKDAPFQPIVESEASTFTIDDIQKAAMTGGAAGGLVVGIFMMLCMLLIAKRRRNAGEVKL